MAKSKLIELSHLKSGLQGAKEFAGEVATAAAAAIEEIDNEKVTKTGSSPGQQHLLVCCTNFALKSLKIQLFKVQTI